MNSAVCLILDGGLATELEARGNDLNDALWSARLLIDSPDEIQAVHQAFLEAGADVIASASYQATIQGFVRRGQSMAEAQSLLKKSIQLARKACDEFWLNESNRRNRIRPLVAASIGPYGAFLADGGEYKGDYKISENQLFEFHRDRWHLLAKEAADIMLCETIPSFTEAKVLAALANETPALPTWISFSCRDEKNISDGTLIAECARFLDHQPNVTAIGINCTPPKYVPSLIGQIRSATDKQIMVYPNSGETYDAETKTWRGQSSAAEFGELAKIWRDAGASIIGGCCRTTSEHIRAIRGALNSVA